MTPFERGVLPERSPEQQEQQIKWMLKNRPHLGYDRAKAILDDIKNDEIWINDIYQVNIREIPSREGCEQTTHLSIKRRDKEPIRDWRHVQQIKNELTDPEREGLELYPAESRLIDTANQFHIWVLPLGVKIPCGFNEGRLVDYDEEDAASTGAKQRGQQL